MPNATPRILIADDDEAIIDATAMLLEYMDYQVDATIDALKVIEMAQNSPDAVILDVWMAGVDGRDICRALKSDHTTSGIPIIMISASKDIRDSALACGANDFLEKPFEIETLVEKIERLIA